MSFLNCFKMTKIGIVAVYEKISEKAVATGTTAKEYLNDEKNVQHISLVIYDLLPLAIKLGLRHETFHNRFYGVFSKIRDQVFQYENDKNKTVEQLEEVLQEATKEVSQIKKKVVKKASTPKLDINKPIKKSVKRIPKEK